MNNTLFVGEMPSTENPGPPLGGRCGERLGSLLGVSCRDFLTHYRRVNLIAVKHDSFPRAAAALTAATLPLDDVTGLVLCGRNVARAFGIVDATFLAVVTVRQLPALLLPHPSTRCRWWNDRRNVAAAAAALQAFVT